jgi:hypothetical protein
MDDGVMIKLAVVAGASAGLAYWLLSSSNCSKQAKFHSICSTAAETVSYGSEEACAAKAKQGATLLSSVSLVPPILDQWTTAARCHATCCHNCFAPGALEPCLYERFSPPAIVLNKKVTHSIFRKGSLSPHAFVSLHSS